MTSLPLPNIFLILGIVFVFIAVIGQSKLGFIEINPGCLGRLLALFIGVASLSFAIMDGSLTVETIDAIRNYLARAIQENLVSFNKIFNS
ncbi:MAG: hypothetical protein KME40_23090 [Komarekiella atlantica HA4396-MV6]|jgi:hypothetical protein|nr:hypothetical protein [Komarekiella atlantica HA4396-MV6]